MQFELRRSLLGPVWLMPQRTLNADCLDQIHWNLDNIVYDVYEAVTTRIARHLHEVLHGLAFLHVAEKSLHGRRAVALLGQCRLYGYR